MFASSAALLAFATLACAGSTYTVAVGIDETTGMPGTGFDPNDRSISSRILPQVGDTVVFTWAPASEEISRSLASGFQSAEYSVTQTSFDQPCTSVTGWDSGVHNTTLFGAQNAHNYTIIIPNMQPYWFASTNGNTCQQGAVFSINSNVSDPQTDPFDFAKRARHAQALAAVTTLTSDSASSTSTAMTLASITSATVTHTPIISGQTSDMSTTRWSGRGAVIVPTACVLGVLLVLGFINAL
ncbi:uncharacterized protein L969DRAFT_53798 [Mixia osmundae IAM 14324]|uniref:Phytocyanin domain-containing protein n=1 Tax=Mixia osmundae (strain CBS 9802 / IAM 14324 / JCM 22182 / KY 12970) TaxID=764103 RepID=G7DSX2_MIXOS|nr:uncharacterized protein L969DRAFT_53798 [Mixia osmundae IAM 14324]KEI37096.1 hypothetical protein L969DRAFT_53798 [Mixia osmundae IAM 14324]GAA93682.1 hypothetical protein E5Q_00327 [Mixia osmundae IAM 14324]